MTVETFNMANVALQTAGAVVYLGFTIVAAARYAASIPSANDELKGAWLTATGFGIALCINGAANVAAAIMEGGAR